MNNPRPPNPRPPNPDHYRPYPNHHRPYYPPYRPVYPHPHPYYPVNPYYPVPIQPTGTYIFILQSPVEVYPLLSNFGEVQQLTPNTFIVKNITAETAHIIDQYLEQSYPGVNVVYGLYNPSIQYDPRLYF